MENGRVFAAQELNATAAQNTWWDTTWFVFASVSCTYSV